MKILNRGLRINTNNENALEINGVPTIDKDGIIYGDIHASTGSIGTTELASDAVTTAKILNANVTLAKLAATIAPSHIVKFFVLGSTIVTTTLTGLLVGDLVVSIPATGAVTVALCAAPDTLPADPLDTTYVVVFRAVA